MSKIYEALNRAESDLAGSAETMAKMMKPLRVSTNSEIPVQTPPLNETFHHELDFDQIREASWYPDLQALPAVSNRGGALEQFRGLRSHLQEFRDQKRIKTILVSSGLPQEGKSFVSANLAVSFARHKSTKVLLIDGDMRRSSLQKILGANATPGLSEYLSGEAELLDVVQRAKQVEPHVPLPKGLSSLAFIPAGGDAHNAAELSGSPRFAELLSHVGPLFDWIIVDSSPVNLVSDGVNLARHCDAALLVARGGVTEYKTAQRAVSELKASTILGFVLNAVSDHKSPARYYGYDNAATKA
jgi:protein-tyrosine kinase